MAKLLEGEMRKGSVVVERDVPIETLYLRCTRLGPIPTHRT